MMNKHTVDILDLSDKLLIARLALTIWLVFSSFPIFMLFFSAKNKAAKYEKLGQYLSYCTRDRTIIIGNR